MQPCSHWSKCSPMRSHDDPVETGLSAFAQLLPFSTESKVPDCGRSGSVAKSQHAKNRRSNALGCFWRAVGRTGDIHDVRCVGRVEMWPHGVADSDRQSRCRNWSVGVDHFCASDNFGSSAFQSQNSVHSMDRPGSINDLRSHANPSLPFPIAVDDVAGSMPTADRAHPAAHGTDFCSAAPCPI